MNEEEPRSPSGAIAINGATGYIGTHVADELIRRGETVVCLVRERSSRDARFLESRGATMIEVDAGVTREAADVVRTADQGIDDLAGP